MNTTSSLKVLTAAALAIAIVGCASKKATDTAEAAPAPAPAPAAAPAATPEPEAPKNDFAAAPAPAQQAATPVNVVEAQKSAPAAASSASAADGYEGMSSHYTGDTRTNTIYFAFDRAEIPNAAYASLKAHAKHLAGNAAAKLTIEGHCDERGTPEYNIALGERRAKSLKDFLVLNGAKAEQVEVVSFGEEKPAALDHDELSWAKNRRGILAYSAGNP